VSRAGVSGSGVRELHVLAAKLKAADKVLRRRAYSRLREASEPITRRVRAGVAEIPSHHDGSLRREIANTITSRVSAPAAAGCS
jgi:ribose 1,5-bisphosphokinase PhnN